MDTHTHTNMCINVLSINLFYKATIDKFSCTYLQKDCTMGSGLGKKTVEKCHFAIYYFYGIGMLIMYSGPHLIHLQNGDSTVNLDCFPIV